MVCSAPLPPGIITGLAFVDPPCVDLDGIVALTGGKKNKKIINPITKRLVNASTPLGKKLSKCPEGKVYNPKTDKYVDKNGRVGKSLLNKQKNVM